MFATARCAALASGLPCRLPSVRATWQSARLHTLAVATKPSTQYWTRRAVWKADTVGPLLCRFQHSDRAWSAETASSSSSPLHSDTIPASTPDHKQPQHKSEATSDVLAEWFPMLVPSEKSDLWSALDELNPLRKRPRHRDAAAVDHKLFNRTMKVVRSSFALAQLREMAQELIKDRNKLRIMLQKHQRLLNVSSPTQKDVYVRLLVVEHFKFRDPLAEERAREAKSEVLQVRREYPRHVMQLAMSVHARAFQGLLSQHGVQMTSGEVSTTAKDAGTANDVMYTVTLKGQQSRVDQVVAWLHDLEDMAHTLNEPLTDSISASAQDLQLAGLPSSFQLDNIMRRSQTLLAVGQEAPFALSMIATDEKAVRKAQTMLAKQHVERLRRKERRLFALTAPSLPSIMDAQLPMYSMQMHLQEHIDDLQLANEWETPARLTRQDLSGNRAQVEYDEDYVQDKEALTAGTQHAILQTVLSDGAQRVDDLRICEKMLSDLEAFTSGAKQTTGTKTKTTRSMSVDFGHLLFLRTPALPLDDTLPEDTSQLLNLLPAPLPEGQWPVEHALGWLHAELRKARRSDMVPQQAPMFVPALPPSATKIEAHTTLTDSRPSPFHSAFGSSSVMDGIGKDKHVGGAQDKHDDVRAIIKEMLGAAGAPQSRLFRMLDRRSTFDEHLSLQYSNGTEVVQIKLKRGLPTVPADEREAPKEQHDQAERDLTAVQESEPDAAQSAAKGELAVDDSQEDVDDDDEEDLDEDEEDFDYDEDDEDDDIEAEFLSTRHAPARGKPDGPTVWSIAGIEKTRSVQTDVLIPDAPVDARMAANDCTAFAAVDQVLLNGSVDGGRDWQEFMRKLQAYQYSHLFNDETATNLRTPNRIELEGRTYTLVDQQMKGRWTWNVVEDPELSPFPVQVHYSLSHDLEQAKTTASLQMRWDMDEAGGRGAEAESAEGEKRGKTIWQVIQRQIAPVLALPYSGGRGYDG